MIVQNKDSGRERRCAVIMAGGDGTRLAPLTRAITGTDVPKQFCALLGSDALLTDTRRRARIAISPDDTMLVVSRKHEPFYAPLVNDVPARNLIVQPSNRGTAPALLYALLRIAAGGQDASIAVMPSDHFFSNEREFMRHVGAAFDIIARRPELTVMLGMAALTPETSYGWIEPGPAMLSGSFAISSVRNFVAAPAHEAAIDLMRRGSLWNSCVIVARLSTLLALVMMAEPELYLEFAAARHLFGTAAEREAIERLYEAAPARSFAYDVLASCPVNLAVMPVRGVAFTDLGETCRVLDAARRIGITPKWADAASAA